MKAITTIGLFILANIFIFFAWYGPLKFKDYKFFENKSMFFTIIVVWLIVFFVCLFQIPANKIGFIGNNGPFTLLQLKVLQEVIGFAVFVILTMLFFKNESYRLNHVFGFIFLILAVYFMFKK